MPFTYSGHGMPCPYGVEITWLRVNLQQKYKSGFGSRRGCVRTVNAELQRLKPLGFRTVYVVAKATTHKDSRVPTDTLKPPSLFRKHTGRLVTGIAPRFGTWRRGRRRLRRTFCVCAGGCLRRGRIELASRLACGPFPGRLAGRRSWRFWFRRFRRMRLAKRGRL